MQPQTLLVSQPETLQPLLQAYLTFLQQIDAMDCGGDELRAELQNLTAAYPMQQGQEQRQGWFAAMQEDNTPIGCALLRPLDAKRAEICRVYVMPSFRGQGIARSLLTHLIQQAKDWGYDSLWLDTFRQPDDAKHLYLRLGFQPCPPYHSGPAHKLLFFSKHLHRA